MGVLVTDGVDIDILDALKTEVEEEGATLEIIAPQVGGVEASDGSWMEAKQKLDGAPSVLYDAVALLPSQAGTTLLAQEASARDFVADAFAHCKFVGYVEAALPLFEKAGVPESLDEGVMKLAGTDAVANFWQPAVSCVSGIGEALVKKV